MSKTAYPLQVTDPSGRKISLPPNLCCPPERADIDYTGVYDKVQRVLEAPAGLIDFSGGRRYYFRALGWNYSVFIEVINEDEVWKAIRCIINPSAALVQDLLKEGTFIPGVILDYAL